MAAPCRSAVSSHQAQTLTDAEHRSMALPPPQLAALLVVLSSAAWAWASAAAQPTTAEAAPDNSPGVAGIKVSFRPSVAIVVGIFTLIFSLTFLLLMYAKFCHPSSSSSPSANPTPTAAAAASAAAAVPGPSSVPKAVIESLPFFRFATLRGSRQGMECSVCLARFDDADLLRLLPRCRHAFHLSCVDRWLESNASCPLCRTRVDAGDAALGLKYPSSARIVFGGGDDITSAAAATGSGRDLLDIFVERVAGPGGDGDAKPNKPSPSSSLDRHKHRIIVSDAVFKSRWSELNSAALLALDTEMMMLRSTSSGRFFRPDDDDDEPQPPPAAAAAAASGDEEDTTTTRKRLLGVGASGDAVVGYGRGGRCSCNSAAVDALSPAATGRMISSGLRSMSEIVSLPRLRAAARDRLSEEENRYQRWLPIARRTARWFAGRSRGEEGEEEGEGAGVHVVAAHV